MNTAHTLRRRTTRHILQLLAMPVLALALLAGLAACGGGGGYTEQAVSQNDRRALPEEFLTRTAVNYSPYRTSRSVDDLPFEEITPENVLQDLRLVQATGIGTIRLFSSRAFARTVLEVIEDNGLDLKVMLGAYPNPINSEDDEKDNQKELEACIELANDFPDIVLAVSVGNETMVEWSTHKVPVADMARYIRQVRDAIQQPVTTDDNWLFWASVPKEIAAVVDFAAVHVYPLLDTYYDPGLWDWRQKAVEDDTQRPQAMIDAAIAEAKRQYGYARRSMDRLNLAHLPMIIGETGWTAVDTPGGPTLTLRAHPVNQKMYFDALQAWAAEGRRTPAGPAAVFFFQAFDEPWKQGDDGWGLFNTKREARHAVQSLGTCGVTWTCEMPLYTDADAVSWVPPVPGDEVTTPTFEIFADEIAPGLRADAFDGSTARIGIADDKVEGAKSMRITPTPAAYGWGVVFSSPGYEFDSSVPRTTTNLKRFEAATGALTFWVKSDFYPGQIRVEISTDDNDRDGQTAAVVLQNGAYGYCNTNVWCQVTIPVSAFVAANPKLELDLVFNKFVISDIFVDNGKPLGLTNLPPIFLDGIRWVR